MPLRVTIELIPRGDESRKRKLAVVDIENDGTAGDLRGGGDVGNYLVRASAEMQGGFDEFAAFIWNDLPLTLTASAIESRLIDKDSSVRDQAKALFGTWQGACGTYCGRLADGGSEIIQPADFDSHLKVRRFYLRRDSAGMRV